MPSRTSPLVEMSDNESSAPEGNSRRKSGRAVKAPEKFVPNASSSQANGHSKRKRPNGEESDAELVDNDASSEEESEEDDDSPDEEEIRERRRKSKKARKPVAKKPKVNGTVAYNRAPAVTLTTRPKKTKRVVLADDEAEGLYGKNKRAMLSPEPCADSFQ
jgi:cohesin complex subunit SA-1/2